MLAFHTFQATGTIEEKFDCWYLISVKLGEEILSGVLYHPGNPGSSAAMQYGNDVIPYTPQLHDQHGKWRRLKTDEDFRTPFFVQFLIHLFVSTRCWKRQRLSL
ncbi:putative high mobility group B protein 9-like [Forsythia ovata]|uniref:High mobility group B protein 9-like n=1 Tax=Forsythia ovata TaxID=205694 RepID=A0ABD1TBT2_9LAMI